MSNEREARLIYEGMRESYAELVDAAEHGVTMVPVSTAIKFAGIGKAIALELVKERAKTDERDRIARGITDALDGAIARLGRTNRY